jgi:hypothetical protein
MEFTDEGIVVEKEPCTLDELILGVAAVLERVGVQYVVVSGYVAVLLGRARATEDIDVLTERFDADTADTLASRLREAGYWGSAMPLDDLHVTLADDLPVRVAQSGDRVPNVELKFVADEFDRRSLSDTISVTFGDQTLRVVRPELQIAYKLGMSADRDFEDARYLYETVGDALSEERLETYVDQLGVRTQYDRLDGG